MSQSSDRYQAERWLATADDDVRAVVVLLGAGLYAHACFTAQQSGEKAAKALWYALGEEPRGHSVHRLVAECPLLSGEPNRPQWLATAVALDRFYIPTRYPNGLPDLTPAESYFRDDAEKALEQARWMVQSCRAVLERQQAGGG